MSFLFCSWASNEEGKGVGDEAVEDEEKDEINNKLTNGNGNKVILNETPKEKENVCNGDATKTEKDPKKPPFFVMWKNQDEEEYVSDKEEESEKEKNYESDSPSSTSSFKNGNDTEAFEEVQENKDEAESKDDAKDEEKPPMFFAVWKDPNKEEEYISSSSSSEDEAVADDEEFSPPEASAEPEIKEEKETEDSVKANGHDDNDDEDVFDSIAKSVSKSMTTLFCDYDDFEIKQNVSDDNDNDIGIEMNGNDNFEAGSLSGRSRSRSGSIRSSRSQHTDSDTGSTRRTSLREKPINTKYDSKAYDLLFSKPKPISKYFDPSTFLDKTLYRTYPCDVKIKKMKFQIQDWESLLPNKKRKPDDDEIPLSKRRKLLKTETSRKPKPAKPRGTASIDKRLNPPPSLGTNDGRYQPVCKFVKQQCPLCWNFWNVSQAFGRHVINQTCQKKDNTCANNDTGNDGSHTFLSVHTATARTDTYVSTSHVPSLKLLCRGSLIGKNSTSDVAISVKEGLEFYHSLVLPGNEGQNNLWQYIQAQGRITIVSSFRQYEKLCRDPLKVAIYLEKKISRSRVRHGAKHQTTAKWVQKYDYFLKLPIHDMFLSITKDGYRVLEVPDSGKIRVLCLVCNSMACNGCVGAKPEKNKNNLESAKKVNKNVKKKVKNKNKKKVKKSASIVPPLQLHKCKSCKPHKYFKNVAALKSHKKACLKRKKKQ